MSQHLSCGTHLPNNSSALLTYFRLASTPLFPALSRGHTCSVKLFSAAIFLGSADMDGQALSGRARDLLHFRPHLSVGLETPRVYAATLQEQRRDIVQKSTSRDCAQPEGALEA